MILYGNSMWSSPYVLSAFVALREKALPFETRMVALDAGEHLEPGFTDTSLTSRVPALVDGDFALSESSAIVEYLEDAYPAPSHERLLPADIHARARARQIMAWLRSDFDPIRAERSSEYVFYPHAALGPFMPLSSPALRAAEKLLKAADRLVPADGGALFGRWCIADTDLAMMLQRLIKTGKDVPRPILDYADRQWRRPSVQDYVGQRRPAFRKTPG